MLQGRPCQVIRISTSAATGRHRYLGVDLFTKQLLEESSFVTNPAPDVTVETVLGPTFKQYRVLDLHPHDNTVVAMTETGDVKVNLAVIDQSSLWSRLTKAIEARRGSVRVLIYSNYNDNREMAVDMKVVHGSRLDGGTRNEKPVEDGKSKLHRACRDRNESLLRDIVLRDPQSVAQLDKEGRTALFDAVESAFEPGVQLLVECGVKFDTMDIHGKTALDVVLAKTDAPSQAIAVLLLENLDSPVAGVNADIESLLSSAAKGDTTNVGKLISEGTDPNGRDRLGYTALHKAACFGRLKVAQLLIQSGSHVNAALHLGGNAALHAIVDSESSLFHRNLYQCGAPARAEIPLLSDDHVAIVELLLRNRAVSNQTQFSDGLSVQDLVTQRLSTGRRASEVFSTMRTMRRPCVAPKNLTHGRTPRQMGVHTRGRYICR